MALLGWLVLLVASYIVRGFDPGVHPRSDQQTVTLGANVNAVPVDGTVAMSFVDSAPGDTTRPVLFLLHGSPMASSSLRGVHGALVQDERFRVITPDLPGFEGSQRDIPDYSIRSHAAYVGALMDSLHIPAAHLVGYSMSGGVVLEATDLLPGRVRSLQLLSGIGVQELELMGDYYLNRSVHGLQLSFLWGLNAFVPHFGWLDDAILGLPYARNFYDTDQRPLRGLLGRWDGPMQIIHGTQDALVPPAAAREHHRIVPQSELLMLEGVGHGLPFQDPDRAAALIAAFASRAAHGDAPVRATAPSDRVSEALLPFNPADVPPATGFPLMVLILLIAGATLVSEDLASIGAGLMAAKGAMSFEHALLAAFLGILLGDIALYLAGRVFGRRLVALPPFSWMISAQQLDKGAAWFKEKGARVIIASRFIPGTRLPTYVAAGVLKAPFLLFIGYFLAATVLWTPLIVGVSMWIGTEILAFYALYEQYALWVLAGVVVLLYAVFHIGLPALSHDGRRRLLSKWRRLTRWEFWPAWLFYSPVLLWITGLAIRYRSITVFTAANPGMDTGGFLGERKQDILAMLAHSPERVASWILLPAEMDTTDRVPADLARIQDFMRTQNLGWPLVLKPDIGERGHGVWIAHSEEDAVAYLTRTPGDLIAQEFVPGQELGVFYIRYPHETRGHIFSVTDKRPVTVVGDGIHTLGRLIWDHDRAVAMAPLFTARFRDNLDTIVPSGHSVPLVEVGTHCRGSLFTDGRDLVPDALERAIDDLSRATPGFYFGRYDIRIHDPAQLPHGGGFKVLELNGVSSEATHIYDPSNTLFSAWATLFRQWSHAFAIGHANRLGGTTPDSFGTLLQRIRDLKVHRPVPTELSARSSSLPPV